MPVTPANALSQSVVIIGLNAALQKRFVLPPSTNLEPGNVHRAHRVDTGVGGKGQDVGVAMSCLMQSDGAVRENAVLLAQFLGQGAEGEAVEECSSIKNVYDDKTSGAVTSDEMLELQGKIDDMAKEGGRASCVCIMGSMPPGCEDNTYAELTERLIGKESLVLIDSVIGLDPLLAVLKSTFDTDDNKDTKTSRGGAALKLNAAELCKLTGVSKSEADRVTMEELAASTQGFIVKYTNAIGALDYLCITDGKFPGYLVEIPKSASSTSGNDDFRTWQLPAVDLSKQAKEGPLYPIGAGDTVAAGTLAAWQYLNHQPSSSERFIGVVPSKIGERLSTVQSEWSKEASSGGDKGYKMATAFAFGLACGSASCLQEENSVFEVEDAVSFFSGMAKPALQSYHVL
ncbi:predicted protein [Thalassiosira pseudonana CCMP1335]|uniref:Carbohydrate kinase PfkB domain-containing protein n=1 Tax=Thalassiosira pseudonana TaxID=35128 RepID=B8C887_THAPS|nr:predicted protein [Thalassiosira pseudonana CCMP1335]EED90243.1 predicted protein [Thalassiosira pseudonana CCMP1335]